MTKRIGNKDEAQHRNKEDKKEYKQANKVREAVKQAAARARNQHEIKGQSFAPSRIA